MEKAFISIIEKCLKEGKNSFYIYPYGSIGMKIEEILIKQYGVKKIILVDNRLCNYNKKIISLKMLQEHVWKNTEVVLVTSNNWEYYENIRLEIKKYIPSENVQDMFSINPLLIDKDSRVASLAAIAKEIYRKKIEGNVAEAGVYKGDFAKYINTLFPDKKLYLFDSFEGFNKECVIDNYDNCLQTNSFIERLKDTSIDIVMEKMAFPQNIVVKKGYIPETLQNIRDNFCFVNLDMDLYQPTYEALHFFWENMSPGGYIFVHDFYVWDGIEPAVTRFCSEKKIGYMCLTDMCSVAIVKPI